MQLPSSSRQSQGAVTVGLLERGEKRPLGGGGELLARLAAAETHDVAGNQVAALHVLPRALGVRGRRDACVAVHEDGRGLRAHRAKALHVLDALLHLHRLHQHQHRQREQREEEVVVEAPQEDGEHLEHEERRRRVLGEELDERGDRHVQIVLAPLHLRRLQRLLRVSLPVQVMGVVRVVREVQQRELHIAILRLVGDKTKLLEVEAPVAPFLLLTATLAITGSDTKCKSQISELPQLGAATTYMHVARSTEDTYSQRSSQKHTLSYLT